MWRHHFIKVTLLTVKLTLNAEVDADDDVEDNGGV